MPKIVDHQEQRKDILMQCFDLFAEQGYKSLTMRKIASELKISTGSLYHYFPSKEELFTDLVNDILEKDIFQITSSNSTKEDTEARLTAVFDYLEANEDFFRKYIMLIINYQQFCNGKDSVLKDISREYSRNIAENLGIKNPELAKLIFGFLNGVVMQRIVNEEYFSLKEQCSIFSRIILSYIKVNEQERSVNNSGKD